MMKVKELKDRIKELAKLKLIKIVKGGDDMESEIVLVPVDRLVGYKWKKLIIYFLETAEKY